MTTRDHKYYQQYGGIYFLTLTVHGWKHIFIKKSYLKLIVETILFFQNHRKVSTIGYCIMPNHIHWLLKLDLKNNDYIKVLQTFKSYTATQIIKILEKEIISPEKLDSYYKNNNKIKVETPLRLIQYFHNEAKHYPAQKHVFWLRDSDVKLIESEKFLRQKLNYIHNNPVQEHWALMNEPVNYFYSSCAFYETGIDNNGIDVLNVL